MIGYPKMTLSPFSNLPIIKIKFLMVLHILYIFVVNKGGEEDNATTICENEEQGRRDS